VRFLISLVAIVVFLAFLGSGGILYVFYHYGQGLPDYRQLADYQPPTVTRVHAGDGRLLAEYAVEKRAYVPVSAIPRRVVYAFLAAEDKNFYSHPGVDFMSVVRAVITNLANMGSDKRPVGASTITQQVAKNFLLTNEVSIERKVKEAILAFRIEHAFDKERILDLYLNEIYLGFGSYGVAAAALNYFNKSLDELTVGEAAYLAALPKAPNNYHPIRQHAAAVARRNWVIGRMLEDGRITFEEAQAAWAEPLQVYRADPTEIVHADYFVEEVRRELSALYGDTKLYEGGLSVRTTLNPRLQRIAERSLRAGLIAYDRRHGWRGPVAHVDLEAADWHTALTAVEPPAGAAPWILAMVAIPLEMLLDSSRHVAAALAAGLLSVFGSLAKVVSHTTRALFRMIPNLYDVYISIPLRIERMVRGETEDGQRAALPRSGAESVATANGRGVA